MYTEDDEKVTIKEDNSNTKEEDFYTSFNDIEKENTKKKKGKKKTPPKKVEVKDEDDEVDFYSSKDDNVKEDNNGGEKKVIKIIIIVVLAIVLILLLLMLFLGKKEVKGDIELSKDTIALNIGEKDYISYNVIDTESSVTSKFSSSNTNVAIVSDDGEIMAINPGDAEIIISYTIDGVTREKKCLVKVNDSGNINQNISLNLKFEKGKDNTWTNGDVTIVPEATSAFDIVSVEYAINCDDNCSYTDILNKKITISNSGVTKVKVRAKDKRNQEAIKEATVKIDKEAPSVTLSNNNINSNSDVEVCVTCNDSLSGCKQSKFCKKYTESKSNQTITVSDNAGNTKTSPAFNVTIKKETSGEVCKLKVSSSGLVTATVNGDASYYGFNSSYSGSNEKSKQITINASKNGESGAKVVYYYVKNKNGSGGKCFIVVVKTCSCPNGSTEDNCEVTCTFTSK